MKHSNYLKYTVSVKLQMTENKTSWTNMPYLPKANKEHIPVTLSQTTIKYRFSQNEV